MAPCKGWKVSMGGCSGPLDPFQGNTCNTSPVIGVIRARAYTSIRELLLRVLWGVIGLYADLLNTRSTSNIRVRGYDVA